MSIPVEVEELSSVMAEYTFAYLLTTGADGRPRVVAVNPSWEGGVLVTECGPGTAANAGERALVSLVWPPADRDGFSLIVDGEASVVEDDGRWSLRVRPTHAVRHRPAPVQ